MRIQTHSPIAEAGFTLIELMIVIAIIGILAAIAMPNFLSYRDKGFCSAAESDASSIAAAIADYYAIPSHTALVTPADLTIRATRGNIFAIGGAVSAVTITVTDVSGRCPAAYQNNNPNWVGNVFTLSM